MLHGLSNGEGRPVQGPAVVPHEWGPYVPWAAARQLPEDQVEAIVALGARQLFWLAG